MDYDFTKREPGFGRIVFALCIDRKKLTERIVIGETGEVRLRLEHGIGDVYYDRTRRLGQLLLNFEADPDNRWNANAMFLRETYGKIPPARGVRWKAVKPGADFLRKKYDGGEPSAMFAAIRTWEEYLNCYRLNHGPNLFFDRVSMLYRPFVLYGQYRPWREEAAEALSKTLHDDESHVELWYPMGKRPFECVVTFSSFQPVIFYMMNKIEEWGYVFQECKVCGKPFLARSRHYELCGEKCRKAQALEAKRQFDERAKGSRPEQLYESAYYYWYNRLRNLKRAKAAPEKVAAVEEVFKTFREEAKKQKSEVQRGERRLSDFSAWLVDGQDKVDRLIKQE